MNIDDLIPAKVAVQTSLGTIYARSAFVSDWKCFDSEDSSALGMAAVRQLCNRIESKKDSGPLAEEDLIALGESDFIVLTPVISKLNSWGEMPAGASLAELGDAMKAAKAKEREQNKKMLADMRHSIDSSYGFMGKAGIEKIQEQMKGLAGIRSMTSATEALRAFTQEPVLRVSELPRMPMPEDTPLGRATLESANNSRDVVQKMDGLATVVTAINQTLVEEILPAWFKQVEDDQKSAMVAIEQAASGLWWTKWALIVSVVVTVLATVWQVVVARDIDAGNTEQQKQTEVLLKQQLAAQNKLIEQQAEDAAALREVIAALKSNVAASP